MIARVSTVLAAATAVSASVIDLPVVLKNTYSSVKFEVGSPPQEHHLHFDTGSSTIWMVNTDCTETSCPDGTSEFYQRQEYNSSASSTAIDLGSFSTIPYLGGDITGRAFQDVFAVPGSSLEWNQTLISANESSWRFITADGFLGLGFSSIAENATSTLVETLLWKGALDAPRFSLFYGTNLGDEGPQDGVLTIGGSHEDKYADGEMVYVPLKKTDEYQLWRAPLRSVNVLVARNPSDPNSTVEIRNGRLPTTALPEGTYPKANTTWSMYGSGSAVFDTGAGRLSVPQDIASAMYYNLGWDFDKLLHGQQRMECQHLNASWAVTLTLGEGAEEDDVSFTMRGDEFTEPGAECMPPFDDSSLGGFALVGSAFLQRYYSVFDFGGDKVENYQPKIGFVRLKKEYDYLFQ
jgi:saccharopepsin